MKWRTAHTNTILLEKRKFGQNCHSLSLLVIWCHRLSLVVTRCTTCCHSLSLAVTCCTTRCHSLYHLLSFIVTRCHLLYHSLSLVVTRCHSLSLVVPLVVTRCHSLSLVVPLVCLFINNQIRIWHLGVLTMQKFINIALVVLKISKAVNLSPSPRHFAQIKLDVNGVGVKSGLVYPINFCGWSSTIFHACPLPYRKLNRSFLSWLS